MGWCSATGIFDDAVEAAYKLKDDLRKSKTAEDDRAAIVRFADKMRVNLENGDWDCQQESDYYEDFKWDLWPEWAAEEEEERRLYGD